MHDQRNIKTINILLLELKWGTSKIYLGAFSKISKSEYHLRHACLSVCLSTWNNSAPTGRIFMKFAISGFLENP